MLVARDGVAGNELDAVGQVGADIADHSRLNRSDIGDDVTSLDLRSCPGRERRVRADRNAEDHKVGALHGLGGITVDRDGKTELVDGGWSLGPEESRVGTVGARMVISRWVS